MNEFFVAWHNELMGADRVPEIIAAMFVTAILGMIMGPMLGNANPLIWQIGHTVFGRLGDKMDKSGRPKADLMFRGLILGIIVITLATALGKAFDHAATALPHYNIGQILLLTTLITTGSIWFALLRLYTAIENKKIGEGAFYAIARSSRVNLVAGDDYGITRVAMRLSVIGFDKGLVAPVIWYILGGFPAASIYVALAFMNWRFGRQGAGSGFAAVPLALERLMGFIPSMLSAMYITLAAMFTPTAKVHKGIASWLGHKNRASYEQGGFPLSALCWALNVSLGGPVQDLSGNAIKADWVGPEGATAQLDHNHLKRALYISFMAHLLFIASLLGLYMWSAIL